MKQGWEYKKLDDCCEIKYGTRVVQKKDGGTIYPVYGGGGETFHMDRYNREDCLVVARFAMSKTCVRYVTGKFFLNDSGLSINAGEEILQSYLNHHIMYLNDDIYNLGKGAAQRNLDVNAFRKLTIAIPPISVQQSIIAELDEINNLLSLKRKELETYDKLAQSLFYDMFGDPVENEKGWEVKKLGEVCEKITDGTHNSPANEKIGDYKYVTAKNIKKDGIILDNITYVDKDTHRTIYERCDPKWGDVLYIKDGVTTGVATINSLKEEFSLLSSVALLRPGVYINNQYLKAVLNMPEEYDFIRSNMGDAAITRLTIVKIKNIKLPLPPLSLQQLFAQRIELIEKQKAEIKSTIQDLETLFASRMQYWFE